jgi:predicted transcriptional regulator
MIENKDTIWNLRVRPIDVPLIKRLNRASEVTDRPASQIVREAIRKELDRLAIEFPRIDEDPSQQAIGLLSAEVA